MAKEPMRFDVVFPAKECPRVEAHFCREWDESGGCYGTNPNHGYTLEEACEEVAQWYEQMAELWRKQEHWDLDYYKDEANG